MHFYQDLSCNTRGISCITRKQDKRNRPEDFTTRFKTQLILDDNTNYYLLVALEQL